jgi:hypothetical protein
VEDSKKDSKKDPKMHQFFHGNRSAKNEDHARKTARRDTTIIFHFFQFHEDDSAIDPIYFRLRINALLKEFRCQMRNTLALSTSWLWTSRIAPESGYSIRPRFIFAPFFSPSSND